MSAPVPVLLLTHPGFGEGLLEAAKVITDDISGIDVLTNHQLSPDELEQKLDTWFDQHEGDVLVLTDLTFGSCCQSARRVSRGRQNVGIVSGINLPMLLAVVQSHSQSSLAELLDHLATRGRGSVETFLGGASGE
ncbi:MAG: hypothetical protein HKN21_04195 [Candidatus Eisenbacteria bacterium]|uniref:PTS EIIA type-4 domain-containing protein n=1 Tax=Eiseniibacteriota bacterium TaxID=2212470 RepID=A0A7Y2ED89_UNCEI|nr:hypothetical protein [Candidatus Eisenbacteria bacterium]